MQDVRGRWYVNLQCEVEEPGVLRGNAEIGIDLGLTNQLWCSDMDGAIRLRSPRRLRVGLPHADDYPGRAALSVASHAARSNGA